MEFYYHDISPPTQAVWMTLNMLGIKYEAKVVDLLKRAHRTEEYLKINPMGKVPAIKDGDFILTESRAIAVYLCEAYEPAIKDCKLYPYGIKEKARVNMLLNLDATCYSKMFEYVNVANMLKGEAIDQDKFIGAKEALSILEMHFPESPYFTGDYPTIADIFVLSSVKLFDLITFNDWVEFPKLQNWKERMEKLPHYEDCMGKHVRKYAEFFKK